MRPGRKRASATVTSPLGSTWIQRGCLRPVANALPLSPGPATGVCPWVRPLAVGILRVGMLPCGFAAGIAGVLPTAGSCAPPRSRRHATAAAPISATMRAKMPDKLIVLLPRAPPTLAARRRRERLHLVAPVVLFLEAEHFACLSVGQRRLAAKDRPSHGNRRAPSGEKFRRR